MIDSGESVTLINAEFELSGQTISDFWEALADTCAHFTSRDHVK